MGDTNNLGPYYNKQGTSEAYASDGSGFDQPGQTTAARNKPSAAKNVMATYEKSVATQNKSAAAKGDQQTTPVTQPSSNTPAPTSSGSGRGDDFAQGLRKLTVPRENIEKAVGANDN